MVKEVYPCDIIELENILYNNKYFENKCNTWRKIIHKNYCSHINKKGDICCTKIKDKGQIYCKHHRRKEIIILCYYNGCKNKCRIYGDYCHKHKIYNYNNINQIENNIFQYDIFKRYNYVKEWERYGRWYSFKNNNLLINKRIIIKEYIGASNYVNYNSNNSKIVKYFNYNSYISNKLNIFYKQIEGYCIKYNYSLNFLISVFNLIYEVYQNSCFKKFRKCNEDILSSDNKINTNNNEILIVKNKKNKKKNKNKKKEKTIDCLYNIFNDKIKNFISYRYFTKKETKDVKKIINDTLNKYNLIYKNNVNKYIYHSSFNIFQDIEKYIEKEIYHDIDIFNKMLKNIFFYYCLFTRITDYEKIDEEFNEKQKNRLEDFIFDKLKNF